MEGKEGKRGRTNMAAFPQATSGAIVVSMVCSCTYPNLCPFAYPCGLTAQKRWKVLYTLLPRFPMLKMPPMSSTTLPSYVFLISPPSLTLLGFLPWIPHTHLNPASKNGLTAVPRDSYHPVCVPGLRKSLKLLSIISTLTFTSHK